MAKITILVDNEGSWIHPYADKLKSKLKKRKHDVSKIDKHEKLRNGNIAFFLGCTEIVPKEYLEMNEHNLVVHASDLPKGKGWSPLTWQILEGKNEIPLTLFEAVEKVDSGPIYIKDFMELEGHELIDEIRDKLGKKIITLCLEFVRDYPDIKGEKQQGKETFYPKRTPEDSEINPKESIERNFDQFRVADNERYPVFFYHGDGRYVLKIYKKEKINSSKVNDKEIGFREKGEKRKIDPQKSVENNLDKFKEAATKNHPLFFKYKSHEYLLMVEKEEQNHV